ncbi:MAG: hypothetical protein ACRDAQ_08305 [Cetobacterium sp.]
MICDSSKDCFMEFLKEQRSFYLLSEIENVLPIKIETIYKKLKKSKTAENTVYFKQKGLIVVAIKPFFNFLIDLEKKGEY